MSVPPMKADTAGTSAAATTAADSEAGPLLSPRIRKINRILKIVYTPLMLNVIVVWILSTSITASDNWECLACRADKPPSTSQQFLYYSVWSFWFTLFVFTTWAIDTPRTRRLAQKTFQLALPHVVTVCLTYIYYVITNPVDEFMDDDVCYVWGRAFLGKTFTDNHRGAMTYLVLMNIMDATVHYLSAPLLMYLYLTRQLTYTVWFPYSTVFCVLLSAFMAIAEIYLDTKLYCGGRWFILSLFSFLNFCFHSIFYYVSKRYINDHNNDEDTRTDDEVNHLEKDTASSTPESIPDEEAPPEGEDLVLTA